MRVLLLAAVLLCGCGYKAGTVYDFDIVCESCSVGFGNHVTTEVRCRGDNVLSTACMTHCWRCGRFLAEPGDDVYMTGLSCGVRVKKHDR